MAPPSALRLRAGEEETIRLPGRGTAGYEWTVHISQGEPETVAVREVDPGDHVPGPPGQSADHVFAFAARRPGRAVVRFEQRRPWEHEAPPLETHEVEVVVGS